MQRLAYFQTMSFYDTSARETLLLTIYDEDLNEREFKRTSSESITGTFPTLIRYV
jgi:hypothetical protein